MVATAVLGKRQVERVRDIWTKFGLQMNYAVQFNMVVAIEFVKKGHILGKGLNIKIGREF